ncbi:hypothetical protein MCEMSEM29_00437 [Methylophilaceae bacterium]
MALTRDFKDTIAERVNRDAQFAQALLDEAAIFGAVRTRLNVGIEAHSVKLPRPKQKAALVSAAA